MKRLIKFGLLGALGLLVVAIIVLTLALNKAVKHGVEYVAPRLTKTDVRLREVELSLFSGKGALKDFVVGSPEGYKAPSAMSVGEIIMSIDVTSLMSDKYVVRSIRVVEPEITFEGGLKRNNLNQLLKNVRSATSGGGKDSDRPKEPAGKDEKDPVQHRIQVDEFVLSGAKVKWVVPGLGGQTVDLKLPTVEMKDLGGEGDGITVGELTQLVLAKLTEETIDALGGSVSSTGGGAVEAAKETFKSLKELFRGKEDSER